MGIASLMLPDQAYEMIAESKNILMQNFQNNALYFPRNTQDLNPQLLMVISETVRKC